MAAEKQKTVEQIMAEFDVYQEQPDKKRPIQDPNYVKEVLSLPEDADAEDF